MERLTAGDQLMLWPDEIWPQDIGALAVLDGSSLLDAGGRCRIEVAREVVAGRLHLVPRFRQLLYVSPRRLGGPLWVDAADFDLDNHIVELRLPAPDEETQLLRVIEQLRQRRLDRSRPAVADVVPDRTTRPTFRTVREDAPRHRRRPGRCRHYCEAPRCNSGRGSYLSASVDTGQGVDGG